MTDSPPDTLAELRDVALAGRLQSCSIDFSPGVTAVLGSSGAGKTSLLNVLVGFEAAESGELRREGGVFWVPANFGLWHRYTVDEHLAAVEPSAEARQRILAALGLGGTNSARPHELSQGQQARLSVARALLAKADWLVMDEPLVHVEPARRPHYWQVIQDYLSGRSLVFSSHEPETVLAVADQVICLDDGRVVYQGEVQALYQAPETELLASMLGRVNWIEPEDSEPWLGLAVNTVQAIRPERLAIEVDGDGPFQVVRTRNCGAVSETVLEDRHSRRERAFVHQSTRDALAVGMRVIIHTVMVCVALLVMLGCGAKVETPSLRFSNIETWRIPIDGPKLPAPRSVAPGLDGETVVLDNAGRVLVYDADGVLLRRWHMPESSVGRPEGVLVFNDGRVLVCDTHYHQIVYFDREGKVLKTIGRYGQGKREFIYPVAITKDADENYYVGEYGNNDRIQKFSREGELLTIFGSWGTDPGQFQRPSGIAWHDGQVYVADAVNNRIQVFTDSGKFLKVLALHHNGQEIALHLPYDLTVDGDGRLYCIEYGAGRITMLGTDGEVLGRFGKQGSQSGQFATPWGIAVDDKGNLRVADTGNRRLVALSTSS